MPRLSVSFRRANLIGALIVGLGMAAAPLAIAVAASPDSSSVPPPGAERTGGLKTFRTEAEAKQACRGDSVVWHARHSKVFHASGSRYYGKTKHGSFVCEKAAEADGLHASKL